MTLAAVLLAVLATLAMAAAVRGPSRTGRTTRPAGRREVTARRPGVLLLSVACGGVSYGLARAAGLGLPAALAVAWAGPLLVALLAGPLQEARRRADRR